MRKSLLFLGPAILLIKPLTTMARDIVIPAGAIVQCTVSDPKFSSKTAELNDPVLCKLSSTRWLLPSGTFLGGRFEEYRDPGHFVGKGWMQLAFDRMVLSDRAVPLTAKVIHVPNLPVDRQGRIRGRGHPVRDAIGWTIPVLWPIKVVTLPNRGPRPTLKNEARLTVKLMDDVIVPDLRLTSAFSLATPASFSLADKIRSSYSLKLPNAQPSSGPPISLVALENSRPVSDAPAAAIASSEQVKPDSITTILVAKDGTAYLASDYWFEDGQRIRFQSPGGVAKAISLANLDYGKTVQVNQERGVPFVIRNKGIEAE
jgi:hypothetical protein